MQYTKVKRDSRQHTTSTSVTMQDKYNIHKSTNTQATNTTKTKITMSNNIHRSIEVNTTTLQTQRKHKTQ